jgi:hypothetical protein
MSTTRRRRAPARNPDSPASFEGAVVPAVHAVRDAFARIIECRSPGARVVTALAEAFGVHRKLAWQVSKVTYSEDPFVAARYIPSPRGMEAWLEAARTVGVPKALLDRARVAAERFADLAASHASSRDELEMLLESCASKGNGDEEDSHARWREQSFRGNSFVWGAHCRVLMALMVLLPSDDVEGHFHCAQVRGLIAYRPTRAGVRWVVNQSVVNDDRARVGAQVRRVPLDEDGARAHAGVPIIPSLCSRPLPRLSRRGVAGMMVDEFVAAGVGQRAERTLVTGEVARNLGPARLAKAGSFGHFGTGVRIPAEALHLDLFVHRTLFDGGASRDLRVFSDLAAPASSDEADSLPVPERITELGAGLSLAHTPDIPGYTDLAGEVFERLGADPPEFTLLRVRMAFPPMPTSVMVRLPFPVAD